MYLYVSLSNTAYTYLISNKRCCPRAAAFLLWVNASCFALAPVRCVLSAFCVFCAFCVRQKNYRGSVPFVTRKVFFPHAEPQRAQSMASRFALACRHSPSALVLSHYDLTAIHDINTSCEPVCTLYAAPMEVINCQLCIVNCEL